MDVHAQMIIHAHPPHFLYLIRSYEKLARLVGKLKPKRFESVFQSTGH
jgi:hypothetical protein